MSLPRHRRLLHLVVGLAVVMLLVDLVWLAAEPAGAASSPGTERADVSGPGVEEESGELVGRRAIVDVFAVRTWEPPSLSAPRAVWLPPPGPEPPRLPFRVLGRIEDEERGYTFLLAYQDSVRAVAVGGEIDDLYRLEKLEDGQLHFLYHPLNRRQTLPGGGDR